MKIKRAVPADAPDMSRTTALGWKAAYAGLVPQAWLDELDLDHWARSFELLLTADIERALVMQLGDRTIGHVIYGPARDRSRPGWGELMALYLRPEFFGQGYGAPLLLCAQRELQRSGCSNNYLWVLEDNQRARRFYEKHGWGSSSDRRYFTIMDTRLAEIRYEHCTRSASRSAGRSSERGPEICCKEQG